MDTMNKVQSKQNGTAQLCDGESMLLENSYFHRDRMEDAEFLIKTGMLPIIVCELTGWPRHLVNKLIRRTGISVRSGKARKSLVGILRIPAYHAAISRFVFALEHQLEFYQERRLTAKTVSRAIRFYQETMPETMSNLIDASAYHSIGEELLRGNVKTTICRHCGGHYAAFNPSSELSWSRVFDCPQCRMLAAMRTTKKGQLNIRQAIFARCNKTLSTNQVQEIIDLMFAHCRSLANAKTQAIEHSQADQ